MSRNSTNAGCYNIGTRGVLLRIILAFIALSAGLALAVILLKSNLPIWYRAATFIPFWFGCLCLLQANAKTCVVLAAKGVRDLDTGEETIDDPAIVSQLRKKTLSIHLFSILIALILTIASLAINI